MRWRITTSSAVVSVMLLAAALAVGSDGSVGRMRIETDPADATVYCDGVPKGNAPVDLSESGGEHLLAATKDGYDEIRKSVNLEAGQNMIIKLALEPVQGLVLIHSDPSGADVQINGADRGRTPLLIHDLSMGKFRIRFNLEGFVAKEMDLDLKDRTPTQLKALLVPDSGTLAVDSTPRGADVTLDGLSKGTTPTTLERVKAGEHIVELKLDGYVTFKETVKLSAGQKEELTATLSSQPAQLSVESLPPQARIYVENQFRGEAPLKLPDMAPGEYRIRAELKGYEPLARTITLASGQSLVEEFRLSRDSGVLELVTEPAGVRIKIDGEDAGTSKPKGGEDEFESEPLTVDLLPIGKHKVELFKTGWFDSVFEIQITKEVTTRRRESLKRNFVPDYEVRTDTETVKGVLIDINSTGDVRLETRPGIFRTIPAAEVKVKRPLSSRASPGTKDQKDSK